MALKTVAQQAQSESPLNGNGWLFLQDLIYTPAAPLIVPPNTKTRIPNNALGVLTMRRFAPVSAEEWYNPLTSTFHCDAPGDFFQYRLNFTVESTINHRNITVDFDIGTANTIYENSVYMARGAGIPLKISMPIPISASNGFFNNGGTLNITSECEVRVYRISIVIQKNFKGPSV